MTTAYESDESGLRYFGGVVWRYRWLVLLATLVVVSSALFIASRRDPVYEATSEMLLQGLTTEQLLDPELATTRTGQGIDTEVALLRSASMVAAVEAKLGYEPDIDVRVVDDSNVVTLTASNTDPARAAEAANVWAETYVEQRRAQEVEDLNRAIAEVDARLAEAQAALDAVQAPLVELDAQIAGTVDETAAARLAGDRQRLQSRLSAAIDSAATQRDIYRDQRNELGLAMNLTLTGGAQILDRATPPTDPTGVGVIPTGVLFGIVGLLFGMGLAFLFERLDDSTKSRDDLRKAVPGVPVLALLPRRKGGEDALVASVDPRAPSTEAYRSLRTSLQYLQVDKDIVVVQVTSPGASEGKTTTVANLAVTLAWTNKRVIVVGCDLRRPAIHDFFGLPNDVGVSSVLIGEVPLDEALQRPEGVDGDLLVLTSGPVPPNPAELLGSQRTTELVRALRDRADIVLLDCPPVLPVTDALLVADLVDVTMLVTASGVTKRRDIRQAVESLQEVDAPLAGTILNGVPQQETAYGSYTTSAAKPKKERGRRKAAPSAQLRPVRPAAAAAPDVHGEEPAPAVRSRERRV